MYYIYLTKPIKVVYLLAHLLNATSITNGLM